MCSIIYDFLLLGLLLLRALLYEGLLWKNMDLADGRISLIMYRVRLHHGRPGT